MTKERYEDALKLKRKIHKEEHYLKALDSVGERPWTYLGVIYGDPDEPSSFDEAVEIRYSERLGFFLKAEKEATQEKLNKLEKEFEEL